jgi:hypothetical protein
MSAMKRSGSKESAGRRLETWSMGESLLFEE